MKEDPLSILSEKSWYCLVMAKRNKTLTKVFHQPDRQRIDDEQPGYPKIDTDEPEIGQDHGPDFMSHTQKLLMIKVNKTTICPNPYKSRERM